MSLAYEDYFKVQAEAILSQLGGQSRLIAMIGAKDFIHSNKDMYLSFRFTQRSPARINFIKVTLAPADTYTVELGWIRGVNYTVRKTIPHLYCNELIGAIEKATELRLRL